MIKKLAKYLDGYRKDTIITPVFMILEVLFEMLIPLLMGSIIDDGVKKGDMNHIYMVGTVMVVAAGL